MSSISTIAFSVGSPNQPALAAINPDFAELPGRKKGIVIATVGLFLIIGFGIGARNDLLLNCGDFKISGNDLPANCVPVTSDS
jgi:hypothetical protein